MSWLSDKWNNMKSTVSNAWKETIKPTLEKVNDKINTAIDYVEEKYEEFEDYLSDKWDNFIDNMSEKFSSKPAVPQFKDFYFAQGKALSKEEIENRANAVAKYKEEIQIWSENQGGNVASGFVKLFEMPLSDSKELGIDIEDIENTIAETSENFKNIIRDYVNERIGTGNAEFRRLCENEDSDYNKYISNIQEYTKQVQAEAKKELLNQFKESSKSTKELLGNEVIAQYAKKKKYLEELKQKWQNLSGKEETINKELLRTGKIVAITTLIESIANEEIVV